MLKPAKFSKSGDWTGCILVHGNYSTGKTRLGGDLLASLAKQYPDRKVFFGNFVEEDGMGSAAHLGLDNLGYDCAWDISNADEFVEFLKMCEKEKPKAVVLDSMKAAYACITRSVTKNEDRSPRGGSGGDNEWTTIHLQMTNRMTRLRQVADLVFVTCPSDLGHDMIRLQESGQAASKHNVMIVPDLSGKMASACISWFDLVGYLSNHTVKQGKTFKVTRTLSFVPGRGFLVRQRIPNMLSEDIVLPEGDGSWDLVYNTINTAWMRRNEP